jgi:DNA-binding CsgD family transcriptional regulator/PAS domain-containing protein
MLQDPGKVLTGLIQLAYEAAIDPRQWTVFLDRFAHAVRSPSVALLSQDLRNPRGSVSEAFGFDPLWERRYTEYFGGINVWIERAPHLFKPGVIPRSDQVLTDSELLKTEFYNDFLRPQNHFYSFGGILLQDASVISSLAAMRSKAAGPFGEREVTLLSELTPHLQSALRVHGRLSDLEKRLDGFTDALNQLAQGVLLVDANGRVTFMNRYAEEIVRAGEGLRSVNGIVDAAHPNDSERLHRSIADVAGNPGSRFAGQVMTIRRSAVGRELSLTLAPVTSSGGGSGGRTAAIIFVTDPDRIPDRKARELEHLLELTPAEARLAKALAEGNTISRFAENAGVSMNTARSHLKRIFAKTGVSRQSDLVRLVAAVPLPRPR